MLCSRQQLDKKPSCITKPSVRFLRKRQISVLFQYLACHFSSHKKFTTSLHTPTCHSSNASRFCGVSLICHLYNCVLSRPYPVICSACTPTNIRSIPFRVCFYFCFYQLMSSFLNVVQPFLSALQSRTVFYYFLPSRSHFS